MAYKVDVTYDGNLIATLSEDELKAQSKEFNCGGKIFKSNLEVECYLDLPEAKSSLEDYTWAEVKELSDLLVAGTITTSDLSSTYNISVGSTKTSTINSESHTYRIVDFLHDLDENDNYIGMTFEQTDLMTNTYFMNSSQSRTLGYTNASLKTTIESFAIASDLAAVITAAKKTVGTSVSSSTATTFTAKLWPMSEKEIAGSTSYSKCTSEGTEYAYYTNGNSRVKNKSGSAYYYWLRSPYKWLGSYSYFALILNSGYLDSSGVRSSYGVAPCFCV